MQEPRKENLQWMELPLLSVGDLKYLSFLHATHQVSESCYIEQTQDICILSHLKDYTYVCMGTMPVHSLCLHGYI